MRFLAHVVMRPKDNKPVFTVETEFDASSWGSAYQHCMGLGDKFDAVVQSHRLKAVDGSGEQAGTQPLALPAPPPPEPPKPAIPAWCGLVTVAMPTPAPWPTSP